VLLVAGVGGRGQKELRAREATAAAARQTATDAATNGALAGCGPSLLSISSAAVHPPVRRCERWYACERPYTPMAPSPGAAPGTEVPPPGAAAAPAAAAARGCTRTRVQSRARLGALARRVFGVCRRPKCERASKREGRH
jgi:hypothetical protein